MKVTHIIDKKLAESLVTIRETLTAQVMARLKAEGLLNQKVTPELMKQVDLVLKDELSKHAAIILPLMQSQVSVSFLVEDVQVDESVEFPEGTVVIETDE